ncbi:MAG: OprD family outer membrane porin, partial [Deltaproteobacteria bacterium]|nr:OprD family outer membrane porin [Deltaproteobacteria bacterium]
MNRFGLLSKIKWLTCFLILIAFPIALSLNTYANASLSESIKNGKVNGELKIWYQTNDNDLNDNSFLDKENSIFDAGVNLGYTTAPYRGFNFGVNFYAINDLGAYDNFANKSIHNVDHSETTSWLGEAFIGYNKKNTTVKLGRQNIKSPLINSDDWAVFPNSFEALWIQNRDISNTTVVASYISRERTLTKHTFEDFAGDKGFMLGAENKSIKDIALSGYYYHIKGASDINSVYVQLVTKLNNLNVSTQYMFFDSDASSSESTNALGVLVSTKLGRFDLSGAVSTVDDGTVNAAKFSDNGIKTPLYTASICADGDIAS